MFRWLAAALAVLATIVGVQGLALADRDEEAATTSGRVGWYSCDDRYASEAEAADAPEGLLCGSIEVPVDHDDRGGAKLELALWHMAAPAGPEATRGTLVVNPGGPGHSARGLVAGIRENEAFDEWDLVGPDPRGVGSSSQMECERYFDSVPTPDTIETPFETTRDFVGSLVNICVTTDAELFPHLGTVNVAKDLEQIRLALGEPQLNYLGYSYGTHLGAVYAEMYPHQVGRFVLDGPVLLDDYVGAINDQVGGFEDSLNRFDAACAATADCALQPYGARSVWRHLKWRYKTQPLTTEVTTPNGTSTITMDLDSYMALSSFAFTAGREVWDFYAQALLDAQQGDPSRLWYIAELVSGGDFAASANIAVVCSDDAARPSVNEVRQAVAQEIREGNESFALEFGRNGSACEYVPIAEQVPWLAIAAGDTAPMLVVAKTHDPSTPYEGALEFVSRIQTSRLLTVTDDGHTVVGQGNPCVDRTVISYLNDGELPPAGSYCEPAPDDRSYWLPDAVGAE